MEFKPALQSQNCRLILMDTWLQRGVCFLVSVQERSILAVISQLDDD